MTLAAAVDGLVLTLLNGGLRATDDPSSWQAPCVIVDFWEEADMRETFGGARRYVIPLMVVIPLTSPRAAREQAEDLITTIPALIEADPDLGGAVDSAAPINISAATVQDLRGVEYLTFNVRVEVWA